ncbi:hypothetical protein K2173_023430 [Erythroxylum novogranatense]|uniref:Disease resistance R13L4/SHOC-2-like LRR domain-containing protein n=1 Tax=Erythroxylum novogranatense TaxID=1862640 RepID=A0AAV8TZ39_9ROSI|nr:hypothetical protein K2173_023430 [Erythroxylum novogranatense]
MGTMRCLSFSLFLLILWTWFLVNVESKTFWGDIEVLREFKNGLDQKSVTQGSCLSSWDFSVDPCDNLFSDRFTCGLRCDFEVSGDKRVTELSLDQAGYSAKLTSISWNLPYLQVLDLSNNNFYGQIPGSFSNLTRLTRLALSKNWFSGEIPASIGSLTNLEDLYFDNNILQGSIPASFNGLVSVKRLEIQSNNLYGEFPDLGSLKDLYLLDASDNRLSGKVTATLPSALVQISMRNNSFEGTIPESFRSLVFLQVMDLSFNNLSGSVPSLLFSHPSLEQLTLSYNHFTTVQSPTSSTAIQSELIAIDISNNELQGFLPSFMALMPKLAALSLENNKFTGMVPTQYALKAVVPGPGISPFARLLLGGNYLFGLIPGPLLHLKSGSVNVTLNDNCLYRCPETFFFCRGGDQKSLTECKNFRFVIP